MILASRGQDWMDVDIPVEAAIRLGHATALVDMLREQLQAAVENNQIGELELTALIDQYARMRAYQRRFRGRRDRALRTIFARARRAINADIIC